jgi:PTS system nitrogen regulatory IIA component
MHHDTLDLDSLASLLRRDRRELDKLAARGVLPGRKVGGAWRFARAEIRHWLEAEIRGFDEQQLQQLEAAHPSEPSEPLITHLLPPACVAVPLDARTPNAVPRALVRVAEQSWHVFDPDAILKAVQEREARASTAQENGVALLHPHHPMPAALGESVLAFGRTSSGVPFGAPGGALTDLFFLICCRDERTHLRVLARLSRLLLREGFLDALRAAEEPSAAWHVIQDAETTLLASN